MGMRDEEKTNEQLLAELLEMRRLVAAMEEKEAARPRAQRARLESDERLRFTLEISHTGTWELDLQTRTAHRSIEHDRIFGYEEMLPRWTYEMFLEHVIPEDRELVDSRFRQAIDSQSDWSFECRIRQVGGDVRWIWATGRHLTDEAGQLRRISGIVQDITERKQTEEMLRHYELLARHGRDIIMLTRCDDGRILEANLAASHAYGYPRDELLAMRIQELQSPEAAGVPDTLSEKAEAMDVLFETTHRRKDGSTFPVEVSSRVAVIQGTRIRISIIRDITERKAVEADLAHSHDLMRYIIEHNRSGVAVHDRDLKYIYVSRRYLQDYKVKEQDVIGKHHYEVFPDLPQKWRDVHQKALAGEVSSAEEDPFVREDGTVEWTRWECRPWHEVDGTIGGIIIYTEVINERKRTEQRLRESESLLSQSQEIAHLGSWSLDRRNNKASWSDELYRIFGLEPQEIEATFESFMDAVHPEDRGEVAAAYSSSMREGWSDFEMEHRIVRKRSGEVRHVQGKCVHAREEDDEVVRSVGMVQDVTERHHSMLALRNSLEEKVSLLKEVHHRVKNNLQIVASLLSLQSSRIHDPPVLKVLQDTKNRIRSMALLHEVLYRSENLSRIDFAVYSQELCGYLRLALGSSIPQVRLENRIGRIRLPLDQSVPCGLIINELVSNALKHGFPDGGPGTVSLDLVPDGKGMLILAVWDDGTGLPPGLEPSMASTLGLRLVSRLASQLNGQFLVRQDCGRGASFQVVFPLPEGTLDGELPESLQG
jgi:PAS domain S-box-containing protein